MKLLVAALFSVLFTLSAAAETLYVKQTIEGLLNLRTGPGVRFDILQRMHPGDRVLVLERKGTWFHVQHEDGRAGWASRNYLEARLTFGQTLTVVQTTYGYVTLRSGPGSDYNDILQIYPRERVRVLDARGAWLKVAVRLNTVGWVHGRYVAE